jgi:PKD repeat protein
MIRSLALTAALSAGMAVMAQFPYTLVVEGTITGCSTLQQVNIASTPGSVPSYNYTLEVAPNACFYDTILQFSSPLAGVVVTTMCGGMALTATDDASFNGVLDTATVVLNFNCGGQPMDCMGVPGGSALPGTACTTFLNVPGTWSTDCQCVPNASSCQACFTVASPAPWTIAMTNCTGGGVSPYAYLWSLPDGSTSTSTNQDWTFTTEGVYGICLTITDMEGCTNWSCDTVVVDANGGISTDPVIWDCLQIANGPNLPGTPCTNPATGDAGFWSADCVCLPDSSTTCEAGFWVVQAYTVGDSVNNPGGGVEPIPNEVWVWNLSSGGDGNYQFFWSFGDGSSSTEAYPTHVYATGGPYQLCLTMTDGSGCTSTYCDDVSVDEDGLYTGLIVDGRPGLLRSGFTISVRSEQPTGITERELVENVALWPNPVEDVIGLSFNSLNNASLSLTIFDLNGRVVRSTNTVVNTGQNDQRINVADLEAGMYLLQITNGEQRTSRRFVKR